MKSILIALALAIPALASAQSTKPASKGSYSQCVLHDKGTTCWVLSDGMREFFPRTGAYTVVLISEEETQQMIRDNKKIELTVDINERRKQPVRYSYKLVEPKGKP